jgi:hypothetical protein
MAVKAQRKLSRGRIRGKREQREPHRRARAPPADVQSLAERGANFFVKRGLGEDWRKYENDQGFTHLEELIIYQPADWRKQAREYMYVYRFDLSRESKSDRICERNYEREDGGLACVKIPMYSPIVVTLFHPSQFPPFLRCHRPHHIHLRDD